MDRRGAQPFGAWSDDSDDPALNTSGINLRYATMLGGAEPTARYVIDTSRNAQGPWRPRAYPDPQDWCNPPGRGLGLRPTLDTAQPLVDAYLWVKIPGESDGECTRGLGPAGETVDPEWGRIDPAAGDWFPEMALDLVANSGSAYRALMRSHRVAAHNTATASANKIHDDEVARRYGFGGGLVPGVDVYAYMTHVPAAEWGRDWLARGSMRARFLMPVYEGDVVTVVPGDPVEVGGGPCVPLEVRNEAGATCAVGHAGLPAEPGRRPPWPRCPAWRGRSDPTPTRRRWPRARRWRWRPSGGWPPTPAQYLADVREDLALYAAERVAHPAWVLRRANDVLGSNVRLGPWIHVESEVRHHAPVADGDAVDTRATVTREWEHKGHRFVELDVGVFTSAAAGRPDRPHGHLPAPPGLRLTSRAGVLHLTRREVLPSAAWTLRHPVTC